MGFRQLSSPSLADIELCHEPHTLDRVRRKKKQRRMENKRLDEVLSVKAEQITLGNI